MGIGGRPRLRASISADWALHALTQSFGGSAAGFVRTYQGQERRSCREWQGRMTRVLDVSGMPFSAKKLFDIPCEYR